MADTNNTERVAFEAWAKDNLWPYESQAAAWRAWSSRARLAPQPNAVPPAAQRDELLQVALDFIGTLTGMAPPPIEVAPPEVFAPFYAFVDRVQAITAQPNAALADGWMPIETAPKFSEHSIPMRLLLGYAPDDIHSDGFVSQGHWIEAEEDYPDSMGHDGGWVDECFDFFSPGRSFGAENYRSAGTQPTHWRPLPAPPTLNASKES